MPIFLYLLIFINLYLKEAKMRTLRYLMLLLMVIAIGAGSATAAGELFIYNWTDYTSPELLKKFEKETGIKVTLDTYDSNETLLAKLKAGGGGYDIAIASHNFVPIMIKEGLLHKVDAPKLKGYNNIADQWKSPAWDPGNIYSIPWHTGTTSFAVDTSVYKGDINTYKILFDPPPELQGSIGMFNAPEEVISFANAYLGFEQCNENVAQMKKVLELLMKQKPHVKVYNSDGIKERLVSGDTAIHQTWNGYAMRARGEKPSIKYAYAKEGVISFMDNLIVPKGAKNKDSAIKFMEFMMQPENAALQTNFARYANVISGSEAFLAEDLKTAPEIIVPKGVKAIFVPACSEKAIKLPVISG
jgi:spermidine/putrescine transport system substrate-binding protein